MTKVKTMCVSLNASCLIITYADFGPLIVTTDPDVFKAKINTLSATGGGDIPELSLSGLQVSTFFFPLAVYSVMLTLRRSWMAVISNTKTGSCGKIVNDGGCSAVSFIRTGLKERH